MNSIVAKKRKKKTDTSTDRVETESDTDLEEFCPSPDPMATAALARAITDSEDESPEGSPQLLTPRLESALNTDEGKLWDILAQFKPFGH